MKSSCMSFSFSKIFLILLPGLLCLSGCGKDTSPGVQRSYRMGFQNSAPRADFNLILQALNIWVQRADAAIISTEVPWDSLLAGVSPSSYVENHYKELVNYYRSRGFRLWVYIDPENGLDRASDAAYLVKKGLSIANPEMQYIYRKFTIAMDSILKPEHMGLAMETNLIRAIAPDSIYQGVKKAANDAGKDVSEHDANVKLSISVQAETAWGKFTNAGFIGIDKDLVDFPFLREIGISSYPYLSFGDPADIPDDYYSKLISGKSIPVFIAEGGWSSASGSTFTSTPEKQKEYIKRQGQLLQHVNAIACFQLTFTDIDINYVPEGTSSNLNFFLNLGLVDINLQSKPALEAWDALFNQELHENK